MKKTNLTKTVKENIVKYRKNAGLSQVELAKRMKVSQRVIAYYENEATNIPLDQLQNFADALSVAVSALLDTKVEKSSGVEEIDIRLIRKIKQIEELPRRSKDALWHNINTAIESNAMKQNPPKLQKDKKA